MQEAIDQAKSRPQNRVLLESLAFTEMLPEGHGTGVLWLVPRPYANGNSGCHLLRDHSQLATTCDKTRHHFFQGRRNAAVTNKQTRIIPCYGTGLITEG